MYILPCLVVSFVLSAVTYWNDKISVFGCGQNLVSSFHHHNSFIIFRCFVCTFLLDHQKCAVFFPIHTLIIYLISFGILPAFLLKVATGKSVWYYIVINTIFKAQN